MNVLIATPSYPGHIKSDCVSSLMGLQRAFFARGVSCDFATNKPADVALARNILASAFLHNAAFTHILMVDNDMTFRPAAVLRMLAADKPVIGCACPKKTEPVTFAVRAPQSFTVQDGLCRVESIGMALTLIRRDALEALRPGVRASEKHGRVFNLDGPLFGFFDQIPDSDGELLPEDFSFCERWRKYGDVWALADETIGHIGERTYVGNFVEHLKSSQSQDRPASQ